MEERAQTRGSSIAIAPRRCFPHSTSKLPSSISSALSCSQIVEQQKRQLKDALICPKEK